MTDFQGANNCPDTNHRIVLCVYVLIVTFFNCLLLYFIRHKTSENMKQYKMILYATTIIDFISAWMQFLIGIRVTLENDMQTFNFDGFLPQLVEVKFPGGHLHYLAMLETFTAALSFAFGIIPFIYRYLAICWDYTIGYFAFAILTLAIAIFPLWSSLSYAIMSNQFYEQNSPGVLNDPSCLRSLTSWTSAQAESELYGVWTYWAFRGWFYGLLGILYSYAIIFWCAYRIHVNIGKKSYLFVTDKARSAQRQLGLIIWVQALCPLLVTGFSLIFLYIGIKTEFQKATSFVVLFNSFKIFPILNACISLTLITTYRRSFTDFCRWIICAPMKNGGWRKTAFVSSVSVIMPEVKSETNNLRSDSVFKKRLEDNDYIDFRMGLG